MTGHDRLNRYDDKEGARWAFEKMLQVDPTFILSYTISPKATFLFERVRAEHRHLKGIELEVETEPVVPLDREIPVIVRTITDPVGHVKRLELLHRVKGTAEYQRVPIAFPPPGSRVDVTLPEVPAEEAGEVREGKEGTFVELAVVGYDENGWEVYRGPTPQAPQQLAVGFGSRGPWYTQWWAYGLIASAVTAIATAVVIGVVFVEPENANADYEVLQ